MKNLLTLLLLTAAFGAWSQKEIVPSPAPEPVKTVPQEQEPYTIVDQPAEFPGGMSELKKYLISQLIYPETAKEEGVEGKCYLKFVVTAEGKITNVTLLKGVADCPECDAEAIRLLKNMRDWLPAKHQGKTVASWYNLPVSFSLE